MIDKVLVPPYGPTDAKIAIIGEAPGEEEVRRGKPFVGASGDLLSEFLSSAGIPRETCYLDNVVLERPLKNNIALFIIIDKGKVAFKSPAYELYEKSLLERLVKTKANVLVPVGTIPLYALTGKIGITKHRGSILESVELPDGTRRKVIPTFHPASAFSFRKYLNRYPIVADFMRIREECETPELNLPKPHLIIRPSFEQMMEYLARCKAAKEVAFDIEMSRKTEEITCLSFALSKDSAISIPFVHKGNVPYMFPEQEVEVVTKIAEVLEDDKITTLGQNLSFDFTYMFQRYGIRLTNIQDVMILQALCNPDFPRALQFTTSRYTRTPYYKDDSKTYNILGDRDEGFWEYNAKDSIVCFEIRDALMAELKGLGNEETFEYVSKLIEPLVFMQTRGILTDSVGLRARSKDLDEEVEEREKELTELCGKYINANSWKQVAEYFYIEKKQPPYYKRTKEGAHRITTDDTALLRLQRKGFREATLILAIRAKGKLKGTYTDMPLDDDGRMRSSWNPVGARHGRLSSSQNIFGRGSNMQNIPHKIRSFMKADEGYVSYGPDLSQAEDRIVAYIAPEPKKISAYEQGIDVHRLTAALILSRPYDSITDEPYSAGLPNSDLSERQVGKTCNHALNYKLGAEKLSLKYGFTREYAEFARKRYFEIYPGVAMMHSWIPNLLRQTRTLTNCYDRTCPFLGEWNDDLFREAYAFIPQSSVADKINREGLVFMEENPLYHAVELLGQIHDAIWLQIPLSMGWQYHVDCISALKESLETPMRWKEKSFVIPLDIQVGCSMEFLKLGKKPVTGDNLKELYEKALEKEKRDG